MHVVPALQECVEGMVLSFALWQVPFELKWRSCPCRSSFQHFIAQDGYFLEAFAKAYALAIAKEIASESTVFEVLMELLEGVRAELKMHSAYAAQWGIDKEAFTEPSLTTLAYNNFLLKVAEGPRV